MPRVGRDVGVGRDADDHMMLTLMLMFMLLFMMLSIEKNACHGQIHIHAESGSDLRDSHPVHIHAEMVGLFTSGVTSMQNLEVMGVIYVKFMSNFRRAQRALSPCMSEITCRITSEKNLQAKITSRVTSMQNLSVNLHI